MTILPSIKESSNNSPNSDARYRSRQLAYPLGPQRMSYVLEQAVKVEAGKLFQGADFSAVIEMLENTPLPMEHSAPPPRVHIAVLWLSKGNISKFSSELENATCDWRDTLIDAGLANESWREVLAAKGVDARGWQ